MLTIQVYIFCGSYCVKKRWNALNSEVLNPGFFPLKHKQGFEAWGDLIPQYCIVFVVRVTILIFWLRLKISGLKWTQRVSEGTQDWKRSAEAMNQRGRARPQRCWCYPDNFSRKTCPGVMNTPKLTFSYRQLNRCPMLKLYKQSRGSILIWEAQSPQYN